ncbi:MAG: nucleoside deaminase [Phycisphaerae bacterium]|nr:nucleoside deaminase [Phycisphaerae bacterium]MDW8261808.1 nucleoside deaminase [Phycisphaerales bacterium]
MPPDSGPAELERARQFLRRAVELSEEGVRHGRGGPFGAVVVRGQRIIGEGCNRVLCDQDPTAHAEIVAIRAAAAALRSFDLRGCEIFASSQPCPMCLAAIYWARIDRVYFANTIEDAARIGFDDSLFYREIALPIEQRSLPQVRVELPEAIRAFELWIAKPDRIPY